MSFQARVWTTKEVNDFPDSSFAYIEPGGKKDSEGKTVPRSLRHFPYKDKNGKIDEAHVSNAFSRLPQSKLGDAIKRHIHSKLISITRKLGKVHAPCKIPGCKGYGPAKRKSMLEDSEAFFALQSETMKRINESPWSR
jgi:hypothetical protein